MLKHPAGTLDQMEPYDPTARAAGQLRLLRAELATIDEVLKTAAAGSVQRRIAQARAVELQQRISQHPVST